MFSTTRFFGPSFSLFRTRILRNSKTHQIAAAFLVSALAFLVLANPALAQKNVTMQHNDIGRTGQYPNETILTPANVHNPVSGGVDVGPDTFGKLFSYPVDGQIYAQPLYVQGVTMGAGTSQAGTTHNLVLIATEHDSVYAFDADNNGGANASPLWKITLLDTAHGVPSGTTATSVPNGDVSTGDINPEIGVTGTPVIDTTTNTVYLVGKTKENGNYIQRLHALDLTTGAEKFAGPVQLSGSVSGSGNGSSGGVLQFDQKWENNRPGSLLLNGIIYLGFAAHGDNGPWHGWVLAYNASTLHQTGVWCSTPSGGGSGLWNSGAGLAADTYNPGNAPGGRLFVATGNGSFDTTGNPPQNYGDDLVRLDLNNGVLTAGGHFTPLNQSDLNGRDADVGSGGVLLLPDQSAGGHTHLMLQVGKEGRIYLADRDNPGGYSASSDNLVQEVPVNGSSNQSYKINGLWSMPAYWNGNVYFWGSGDRLKAFSFANGRLGNLDANGLPNPTSQSTESDGFPGETPAISSNGNTNGIVWSVADSNYGSNGNAILYAHDATNVATTLFASNISTARNDSPGTSTKFVVPTIANGKVYVGTSNFLSIYGLLDGQQQAATPTFAPGTESFTGSINVSLSDSTPGGKIYYTTDGSTPTTASAVYSSAILVNTTETIHAIASASGYLQSSVAAASYTLQTQTLAPIFSPSAGSFNTAQTVTITDATSGSSIYYTTNGSTPTTSSTKYTGPISVASTTTINAIAAASGLSNSPVTSATYTIVVGGTGINFSSGFSTSQSSMTFNGSTGLADTRLQLTNGQVNEAGSAWFNNAVGIATFTNDFTFQLENVGADGITFTIQNTGLTALGGVGGGLGYGSDTPGGALGIGKSVAIKFDTYSNAGEGTDSTGIYMNGASPTTPFTDMTGSGINLTSGDTFAVHMTYDGTTLKMTITDGVTNATYTTSWTVNIPSIVGGNTAYVGFSGGTGGLTSSQKIETWTFVSTGATLPATATPTFSLAAGNYSGTQSVSLADSTAGAAIFYTTDGSTPATAVGGSTHLYTAALSVSGSETIKALATASGYSASAVASASYTISATPSYGSGFSAAGLALNGNAIVTGTHLRLTDGGATEAGSAWFNTPVNIQTFTSDFTFQLSNATGDGFTFVVQNSGPTALGPAGGGLGYGPDNVTNPSASPNTPIAKSVAIKFDLYNNAGEGANSTGIYLNGASPTTPAVTIGGGISLAVADIYAAHVTYDGTTLTLTLADTYHPGNTFTTSWPVNIPSTIGGNTAYVGFTGGTGGATAIQDILTWTYSNGAAAKTPITISTASLTAVSSGPTFRQFTYPGFPDTTGTILDATKVGDNVTMTLNVAKAGTYDVKVSDKQFNTRGAWQLAIDGLNFGPTEDEYQATDSYTTWDLGGFYFATAGNYTFKFSVASHNAASASYTISFDDITLTPR